MGIYQGLNEYKPDAHASASILAYTRLRFGLVLVRNYLPLALSLKHRSLTDFLDAAVSDGLRAIILGLMPESGCVFNLV